MSIDWPIVRLGDFCIKVGSGATPKGGANVYLDKGEVCLIRSQNIYNDGFKPNGLVYITEEAAAKLKNVIIEKNDILINITGDSVARVCLAKEEYLPARVNQHVAIIRPDPKHFDARFLRYLLTSTAMQALLLTISAVGATRNALTKNMIETLEVSKPPIRIQTAIADNLEVLDNKIELNRQTNQTLEQIAQAMFKSWFVDFDPVRAKIAANAVGENSQRAAMAAISGLSITPVQAQGLAAGAIADLDQLQQQHPEQYQQLQATAALFPDNLIDSELGEIPEGWGITEIKELSSKLSKGTTAAKKDLLKAGDEKIINFLKVRDISDDGEISRVKLDKIPKSVHVGVLKRSILEANDLLFSIAGTIGRVALVEEDLTNSNCNQAIAFIRLKEPEIHLELCYLNLVGKRVQDEVISKIVQGVQANFSLTGLGEIKLLIPSLKFLEYFNKVISDIHYKKKLLFRENRELTDIRDTLLPRLLSGELSIDTSETEF
ncbi:restriction endonuclease subunit S [Pseudoalteromonas sp. SR41-8]|uniref:restriction endonuclease subunit S n=1 Tax=Pseudoalteromonas sp. SR41-8 TaxID=2760946 RepID=UPI0015FEED8F|nr:restriction endonuclease subunit S [Pseudoalteromonas sp. SR41-8]MBB1307957.1 restriction endonuclease subunit S [Pseudoalteromonas sp. SR41-8]